MNRQWWLATSIGSVSAQIVLMRQRFDLRYIADSDTNSCHNLQKTPFNGDFFIDNRDVYWIIDKWSLSCQWNHWQFYLNHWMECSYWFHSVDTYWITNGSWQKSLLVPMAMIANLYSFFLLIKIKNHNQPEKIKPIV